MKHKVEPVRVADCDCPDCRVGKHLYELFRWQDDQWQFVGISLQGYASTTECQQKHRWGIEFAAEDTWEDGTPILPPAREEPASPKPGKSGGGGRVVLDLEKLAQSAAALEKHRHP